MKLTVKSHVIDNTCVNLRSTTVVHAYLNSDFYYYVLSDVSANPKLLWFYVHKKVLLYLVFTC